MMGVEMTLTQYRIDYRYGKRPQRVDNRSVWYITSTSGIYIFESTLRSRTYIVVAEGEEWPVAYSLPESIIWTTLRNIF
jgi:hypothetical protein